MRLSEKKIKIILFFSVTLSCVISVIWHYDFGFLGGIPFGLRALAFSLFFDHSVKIDTFWQAAGIDTAFYKGHYYSGYPPGASFLAFIFLLFEQGFSWLTVRTLGPMNGIIAWWLESVALSLPTMISSALLAILVYSICRFYKISKKISFVSGWATVFTTIILAYSWQLHYHPIAAGLVFAAFYFLVKNEDAHSKKGLFFIGALYGLASLMEYVTVLYGLPAALYLISSLKNKKKFIYFLTGFLISVGILALYNFTNFASPWHFSHAYQETAYTGEAPNRGLASFRFFSFWYGFIGLYFSFPKGLIFHTPLLLLAPIGGYLFFRRQKRELLLLLSSVLLVSYFYASWHHWEGGYNYGPRYLISTIPFYIFLTAFALEKVFGEQRNKVVMTVVAFLIGVSVIIANANALLGTRIELPLGGATPLLKDPLPLKRTLQVGSSLFRGEEYTFSPFWFRFRSEMPIISGFSYQETLVLYLLGLFTFEMVPLILVILSKEAS